jgi:hypothetical protein
MGQHVETILSPAKRARNYAEGLTKGITSDKAARKPVGPSGPIDTNTPVFVYGHLALYPARLLNVVGMDGASIACPASWDALFKAGVACHDDASGSIYPSWDEVREKFFSATDRALTELAKLHDAQLLARTPEERWRESFPTIGSAVSFLLLAHPMMHLGQVSAWRRFQGLPSAL